MSTVPFVTAHLGITVVPHPGNMALKSQPHVEHPFPYSPPNPCLHQGFVKGSWCPREHTIYKTKSLLCRCSFWTGSLFPLLELGVQEPPSIPTQFSEPLGFQQPALPDTTSSHPPFLPAMSLCSGCCYAHSGGLPTFPLSEPLHP